MLTELKLANFRIFDDELMVRFRPITVFIGRNSSGKSTIIKFLLMLQQSLGPRTHHFLSPDGERVNLGSFPDLKNSLTLKRNLAFELSAKHPSRRPDPAIEAYIPSIQNIQHSTLLYKVAISIRYSGRASIGSTRYNLVDEISNRSLIANKNSILDDSTFLYLQPNLELESALNRSLRFLPDLERLDELPKGRAEEVEKHFGEMRGYFSAMRRLFAETELLRILRYQINSIHHLSPVRVESDRVIQASSPPVDYVGQRGQHALPHLQRMVTDDREQYEFILPHLNSIAGIEYVQFKTSSGYVSQAFARNRLTGADVLIADYGFGVSQCLPILVQGAIMPPYTSLMVEEPEAQLHPTAQLEMGTFFADLWKKRQVGSIIETHSRNILLRLRRLIAKGELSPEDVSVAYFTADEQNNNMPITKNLDINEDGSMEPGLPMEFFGADIMEGLKIGAKA